MTRTYNMVLADVIMVPEIDVIHFPDVDGGDLVTTQ